MFFCCSHDASDFIPNCGDREPDVYLKRKKKSNPKEKRFTDDRRTLEAIPSPSLKNWLNSIVQETQLTYHPVSAAGWMPGE